LKPGRGSTGFGPRTKLLFAVYLLLACSLAIALLINAMRP